MADYTTAQTRGSGAWIIGAIVVGLVVLFIVFAGGSAPPAVDGTTTTDPETMVLPAAPAPATE